MIEEFFKYLVVVHRRIRYLVVLHELVLFIGVDVVLVPPAPPLKR
jgi:hypothetical protein